MKAEITTVVISEQQINEYEPWLRFEDLCERCALQPREVEELVDLGLVVPAPDSTEWRFYSTALARLHQAKRLRRELDLDWQGVAVAMDLLEEIHQLRQEVESLRKQLGSL